MWFYLALVREGTRTRGKSYRAPDTHKRNAPRFREALCVAGRHVQRVMSWCESRQLLNARLLAGVASFPENDFAVAARTNLRGAARVFERSAVVEAMPVFGAALASGDITVEHVDTVGRALRTLEAPQRSQLIAQAPRLALVASHGSLDEFVRVVRDELRRIETDHGDQRLQREQRATRLRAWFDQQSGMLKLFGEFDPVTESPWRRSWTTPLPCCSRRPFPTDALRTHRRSKTTYEHWH